MMKMTELQEEIRAIETEQEEAEHYLKNFQREEEAHYEEIQEMLKETEEELDLFQNAPHLTTLLEEEYSLLQTSERNCSSLIADLQSEQGKVRHQCELTIDELKRELQRIEMGVM